MALAACSSITRATASFATSSVAGRASAEATKGTQDFLPPSSHSRNPL